MGHAPRLFVALVAGAMLLGPAMGTSSATTIEDLIKLKANKTAPVSDDVLIALIESDGSVFHLTADDIVPLKQKGLSERVIIAMLLTAKNARTPVDIVEVPPVDPQDPNYLPPSDLVMTAPPIVPVTVTQDVVQAVERPRYETRTEYTPVYVPVYVPVAVPARRAEPQSTFHRLNASQLHDRGCRQLCECKSRCGQQR